MQEHVTRHADLQPGAFGEAVVVAEIAIDLTLDHGAEIVIGGPGTDGNALVKL